MVDYLDLKRINDSFEPELSGVVDGVVRSGWYLFGEHVRRFEHFHVLRQYGAYA